MKKNILMIDDDLDDQYIYGDIFKQVNPLLNMKFIDDADILFEEFSDSKDAIDFLPDLILLDLNLPKYSGLDIYNFIKNNMWLKNTPVVILTTSSSPIDIEDCRKLGLHSYFIKPMDSDETRILVEGIYQYWFNFNALLTESSGV